tara:strand:- start:303 stop:497 length:195 start_codon:yes stop_codon:yes gene_type:complete
MVVVVVPTGRLSINQALVELVEVATVVVDIPLVSPAPSLVLMDLVEAAVAPKMWLGQTVDLGEL